MASVGLTFVLSLLFALLGNKTGWPSKNVTPQKIGGIISLGADESEGSWSDCPIYIFFAPVEKNCPKVTSVLHFELYL